MSRLLDVYLHNILAGQLEQNDSGELAFAYNENYKKDNLPAISVALPTITEHHTGKAVKAFFSGLLPDETCRQQLAKYLGVSDKNAFSLLEMVGGECAGAISLYPAGESLNTQAQSPVILEQSQLSDLLAQLNQRPLLAGQDGLRLSLAGAQAKLAITITENNQIILAGESHPTTHIIKPPITALEDSIHNEYFCMRLAQKIGLNVPKVSLNLEGSIPFFQVARYDRSSQDGKVIRLHQEDFCQALSIVPENKYEREGGPSLPQCQALLTHSSSQPAVDSLALIQMVVFNYLIGNADAHGKNFSLLYHHKGKPQLAPAYDILCTAVYPELASKMAMKIGSQYDPSKVHLRHWQTLVAPTKAAQNRLHKQLVKLANTCLEQADNLRAELSNTEYHSSIYNDICNILNDRATLLQKRLL